MVYHERVFHNYFISCHGRIVANTVNGHELHDWKVGRNIVEYTTASCNLIGCILMAWCKTKVIR